MYVCMYVFIYLFIAENKVFIHSPRKKRGMIWRDTLAQNPNIY